MTELKAALNLLVALDGSEHSTGALRLVVALAQRGARLHAVVLNVQAPVMVGEVGAIAPSSIASESRHRAATEVLGAADRALAEAGVPHETHEEREAPAAAIVSRANAHGCDAIVVGSRGLGRLRRAFLGSVSGEVVRHADRPVIVVGAADAAPADGPLRVLAAVDGSDCALRALGLAARLARTLPGSELHLLHVRRPPSAARARSKAPGRVPEGSPANDAESAFAGARALLERDAVAHSTRVTEDRNPAQAIAHLAAELGCGMIAMGTRGRGAMAGLLLGSVAQGVLRRVRVPVVLAR